MKNLTAKEYLQEKTFAKVGGEEVAPIGMVERLLTDFANRKIQEREEWISVEEKHRLRCYEKGNWDGAKSDLLLLKDKDGLIQTGYAYSGIMDGSEFTEYYNTRDFEIMHVTHFRNLND